MQNYKTKLIDYLKNQPIDKKFVLVSFFVTNPDMVKELRNQWSLRDKNHSIVLGRNLDQIRSLDYSKFDGSICLLDPDKLETGFILEMEIPHAFGLSFNKKEQALYVTGESEILKIKNGKVVRKIRNHLFNDLHSLTENPEGNLLVTTTGIDGILELDINNKYKIVWKWLATEQGYDKTPGGQHRYIDIELDYSVLPTTTPEHTTHVNTAVEIKKNIVLATLFHQGQLIEIDKVSKKHKVLLSGLSSPHNIKKTRNGYIISDTRANQVILLDKSFNVKNKINSDFNWVQDAIEVGPYKTYLIADSNNDRLILTNKEGIFLSSFSWTNRPRKISTMELLDTDQVKTIFL